MEGRKERERRGKGQEGEGKERGGSEIKGASAPPTTCLHDAPKCRHDVYRRSVNC